MKYHETHLKPPTYLNDGRGRDTYISFFNGGFGSYPYSRNYKKDNYNSYHTRFFADLSLRKPIVKYGADGSGRDYFINQHIISEFSKDIGNDYFAQSLRGGVTCPLRTSGNFRNNTFEKKLLGRVFYGKCPGVKERLMCPKVNFNKKNMKRNLTVSLSDTVLPDIGNITNTPQSTINFINNGKKVYRIKVSEEDEINKIMKRGDDDDMKKNYGKNIGLSEEKKINKEAFRMKKTMKRQKENASSEDMMHSLRTLFLFNKKQNDKKNMKKEKIFY